MLSLLARICAQAGAALPIITLLSLLAGRRGNGQFCLRGAAWLSGLALLLAAGGPIWLVCAYLEAALPYHQAFDMLIKALFKPGGLPWLTSLVAWLAGWLWLLPCWLILTRARNAGAADRYPAKAYALPVALLLLAGACMFAAFILINWPFAGLPEGLAWDRAVMAIVRHANSEYFRGFCFAGAIALLLWPLWYRRAQNGNLQIATRWLAFWAFAGNLPWLLSNLGPALGAALNASHLAAAYGVYRQLLLLALFVASEVCFGILLWRPGYLKICAAAGASLLFAARILPALIF